MKKVLKYTAIVMLIVSLVLIGYISYVFIAYDRLPDRLALEISQNKAVEEDGAASAGGDDAVRSAAGLTAGQSYTVMTYNIGFGAYLPEYSFFMDGGKSSWGKDADSVTAAVCAAAGVINDLNPDFVLLQEVDRDGTRSYHIDELEVLNRFMPNRYYTYAQNYDSPFLFFPPWEPHGANKAGLVTYSGAEITESVRRSLPISKSFSKFVDLDRCYSISRIPLAHIEGASEKSSTVSSVSLTDGKMLCLYNMHMSAYGSSDEIRSGQLAMLYEDMLADYEAGNYVICGGDFNHNLKTETSENAPEWAYPFPRESLPEGFRMAIDDGWDAEDTAHNTCRSADEPYNADTTYTVTLDGFIVSDNVAVKSYRHMDTGYAYSDHDPVIMEFIMQ